MGDPRELSLRLRLLPPSTLTTTPTPSRSCPTSTTPSLPPAPTAPVAASAGVTIEHYVRGIKAHLTSPGAGG